MCTEAMVPLQSLRVGQTATVAAVHSTRRAYLQRLQILGVTAGARLRLRQRQPAVVIQLDHTELALDHEAAQEIFVHPTL